MARTAVNCLITVLLIFYTVTDLKHRRIWWPPAAACTGLGILIHLAVPGMEVAESLTGLLPGIVLFAISFASGKAIGTGDCLTLCAYGSMLGFRSVCEVFFTAIAAAALFALLLLISRKADRKSRLAFTPFLLLAHMVLFLWG